MDELIPPTREALTEAVPLSEEILRNVELDEVRLVNIALRAGRLARLLNDFDVQKIMEYEAAGYPTAPEGVPPEVWRLAVAAGRRFENLDPKTNKQGEYIYMEPIGELEEQLRIAEASLAAARDPDRAISSANPMQYVWSPHGNVFERQTIRQAISRASRRLASRRTFIHQYVLRKHYELKFSGIADDVFAQTRQRVDTALGLIAPDAIQRFTAVHENLRSENPEDWSNAVHSCRRIFQDLADALFPPTDEERVAEVEGKHTRIKLGKEHYVNRIMAFVQDSSRSRTFVQVVGSHIKFLGDRLDSIVRAGHKGTHETIVIKAEADRYVVYTYLLVGDILSLVENRTTEAKQNSK